MPNDLTDEEIEIIKSINKIVPSTADVRQEIESLSKAWAEEFPVETKAGLNDGVEDKSVIPYFDAAKPPADRQLFDLAKSGNTAAQKRLRYQFPPT